MSFELHYALSRAEVWRWYWKAWRRRLWMYHAFVAALGALLVWQALQKVHGPATWVFVVLEPPLLIGFMIAWPQIRFKSAERRLVVGSDGLETWIGKQHAVYPWTRFRTVRPTGDDIVLELKNSNAFIVPNRALESDAQRDAFVAFAQKALKGETP